MGLHIHVSLNRDLDYNRLASVKFHDWFINRLKKSDLWDNCPRLRHRIRNDRLHPQNPDIEYGYYCKAINGNRIIDRQLNARREKYRRITYMKDKYDTIEFRLFPAMESSRNVMEAIELVTTSVNAFLREGLYEDTVLTTLQDNGEPEEVQLNSTVSGEQVTHNV
jgi:hypothetical protein